MFRNKPTQQLTPNEFETLVKVYSSFMGLSSVAPTDVKEKLKDARKLFEGIYRRHDYRKKSDEHILFIFYDDLLEKTEFNLMGDPSTMPQGDELKKLGGFDQVQLMWFSEIKSLWQKVDNLRLSRNRNEFIDALQKVYAEASILPAEEKMTSERAALLALLRMWLHQIQNNQPMRPMLLTTVLPARSWCILRVQVGRANLNAKIRSYTNDVQIEDPIGTSYSGSEGTQFEWKVWCDTESVNRRFRVSVSDTDTVLTSEDLDAYFYQRPSSTPQFTRNHPLQFPSRQELQATILRQVRDFVTSGAMQGSLVIDLQGKRHLGKKTLAKMLINQLSSELPSIASEWISSGGSPTDVGRTWEGLLNRLQPGKIPLLIIDNCDSLQSRQQVLQSLVNTAFCKGFNRAIFICLFTTPSQPVPGALSHEVKALEKSDLIGIIRDNDGLLGEEDDAKIQNQARQNQPFIHFDKSAIEAIHSALAEYPEVIILALQDIFDTCRAQRVSYVAALPNVPLNQVDLNKCIDRAIGQKAGIFDEECGTWLEMGNQEEKKQRQLVAIGLRKCSDNPQQVVALSTLAQYLRTRQHNFDLLPPITYLCDCGMIMYEAPGYRFRNFRFWHFVGERLAPQG